MAANPPVITGLRAADAPIFQRHTGGDLKILLRLGNLLQSSFTFTEAALQGLAGSAVLDKVLDRRLRTIDVEGFPALATELGWDGCDVVLLDDSHGAPAGWRVVALADELGNPFGAEPEHLATVVGEGSNLPALVASLAPALRAPVEGLLSARADDERAAALEQLRYAMPPLAVVGELMPLLLVDGAEIVRERAIGLLSAAGAATPVIDFIRAIQRRDGPAAVRGAEAVVRHAPAQQDLAVAALVAALARGGAEQFHVDCAERLASHIAEHRSLERLVDLLVPTGLSLFDWVRAVQAVARERIDAALARGLGLSMTGDARLIVLLAAPDLPLGQAGRLLDRGLELLLSPVAEPADRLPLAGALRRLDQAGLLGRRLADHAAAVPESWDTAVYWLIAELCRGDAIDLPQADLLATACRRWLREARGPHLITLLESQVPALLPASPAIRSRLVEPLVEIIARYRDDRTRDVVVACLSRLGASAVDPLWLVLDDHPLDLVRMLAAELLPVLLGGDAVAGPAAVPRLLAGMDRIEQATERAARVLAAALLVASPEQAAAIDAATSGLGDYALEALGHLAASIHLPAARRAEIVEQLLAAMQEEVPDQVGTGVENPTGSESAWLLDEALTRHTDNVPRALAALGRIGASPSCPPDLLARLTTRLCRQWKLVAQWRVVWGPGAVQELGRTLVRIAESVTFPGPLRVQVCEALAPQNGMLTVVRGLARVLMHADGPFLARLAGNLVASTITHANSGRWADDEEAEVVEALADLLALPQLGAEGEMLRRRMAQLIALRKDHASSRARARLRFLRADLSPGVADLLEWA